MNRKPPIPPVEEIPRPGESLLARIHRRKTEARALETRDEPRQPVADEDSPEDTLEAPCDDDMPALDSLSPESDYTGFLSPRVSDQLRRAALRKLFHGPAFHVIDELDDYAEDFTTFEVLGDIVTADMRHRIETEARKKAEELEQAILDPEEDDTSHEADTAATPQVQQAALEGPTSPTGTTTGTPTDVKRTEHARKR